MSFEQCLQIPGCGVSNQMSRGVCVYAYDEDVHDAA